MNLLSFCDFLKLLTCLFLSLGASLQDNIFHKSENQLLCQDPFGVTYQIYGISDIYIMINNSSKISYEGESKILLYFKPPQHEEHYQKVRIF